MHLPFPRVGGRAPNVGLSIPSGDNVAPPFGVPINFKHFGHEPLTLSPKKNPSSSVYPIPLPLLDVFNSKRALAYPFRLFLLSLTLLKQPNLRMFFDHLTPTQNVSNPLQEASEDDQRNDIHCPKRSDHLQFLLEFLHVIDPERKNKEP